MPKKFPTCELQGDGNDGPPEFPERTALWSEVIENVGEQLATAGFYMKLPLEAAREYYESWAKTALAKQTLAMRAVMGIVL